jgi:hypothetical protein
MAPRVAISFLFDYTGFFHESDRGTRVAVRIIRHRRREREICAGVEWGIDVDQVHLAGEFAPTGKARRISCHPKSADSAIPPLGTPVHPANCVDGPAPIHSLSRPPETAAPGGAARRADGRHRTSLPRSVPPAPAGAAPSTYQCRARRFSSCCSHHSLTRQPPQRPRRQYYRKLMSSRSQFVTTRSGLRPLTIPSAGAPRKAKGTVDVEVAGCAFGDSLRLYALSSSSRNPLSRYKDRVRSALATYPKIAISA